MSNNYIVYVARGAEGECLYVGEGLPERWKHIIAVEKFEIQEHNRTTYRYKVKLKNYDPNTKYTPNT